jgi:hypothetical protein
MVTKKIPMMKAVAELKRKRKTVEISDQFLGQLLDLELAIFNEAISTSSIFSKIPKPKPLAADCIDLHF